MSDRHSVSLSAQRVWRYYTDSRDDVKKLPLDDVDDPKTPTPKDDGDLYSGRHMKNVSALNNAYELKSGKLNVSALIRQHKSNVKTLRQSGVTPSVDFDNFLSKTAEHFFVSKYVD